MKEKTNEENQRNSNRMEEPLKNTYTITVSHKFSDA